MELKRVIAKDLRTATEQVVANYGPEALIISNERVGNKVEVIVAVDLSPDNEGLFDEFTPSRRPQSEQNRPQSERASFEEALIQSGRSQNLTEVEPAVMATESSGGRDQIRAREIVDLVRQEMSALRREFRVSQQSMHGALGASSNPVARSIDRALESDHAPIGLRVLMSQEMEEVDSVDAGLLRLQQVLSSSINSRSPVKAPLLGRHALFGPSGGGKTTMTLRAALLAAREVGEDRVTVVSWADQKPGAWQQLQFGAAQIGIEALRVKDLEALPSILDEIQGQKSIIIDCPGVLLNDHRKAMQSLCPEVALHLVIPANIAAHQAEAFFRLHPWQSFMLTKLDESAHTWGLIQALCNVPSLMFEFAGTGPQHDEFSQLGADFIVDSALLRLKPKLEGDPGSGETSKLSRQSMQTEPTSWNQLKPSWARP